MRGRLGSILRLPGGSRWPLLAGLLAAGIMLGVGFTIDRILVRAERRAEREAVDELMSPYADAVALAITRRMALLTGLRAFVEFRWESPTFPADFAAFAGTLHRNAPGVRGLQYVVDGVIRQTVPLEGNERAVGLDLRAAADSAGRADLRRAERDTGLVVSGPLRLVQGGAGMVGRLGARDPDGRLLAVVAIVLDLDPLLQEAGLAEASSLALTLRDDLGRSLFGSDSVYRMNPVVSRVALPDRSWQLAAIPVQGWGSTYATRLWLTRLLLLLGALGLGLAAGAGVRRQERAIQEQEARERRLAEERFTRLAELSPDGVAITRAADGTILSVNDHFLDLSGFSREELIGRTTVDLDFWVDRAERERIVELVHRFGVCHSIPIQFRKRGGVLVETEFSSRLFEIDGVPCLISFIRDVTEQRSLHRQLAEAQKLEAVGRLAGGVAHDFNNILTAVMGYAQVALDGAQPGSPVADDLREILRAASRAGGLTRQLLAFARRQVTKPRPIDISAQVQETSRLLARLLGTDVKLALDLASKPPRVLIDPVQLEQVLVNLVMNARDAMPEGGTVTVRTSAGTEGVVLEVRDTGVGIPPEFRTRIFEPFFTTKPTGAGTGLGLATVYGIVRQAEGRVDVETEAGRGTCFRIVFPPAPEMAGQGHSGEHAVEAPVPPGEETILLAEDEPAVRELAARVLKGLGYRVLVAENGPEALARAAEHGGRLDLLLTDVVMPEMGGRELAARLRQIQPGLRILFVSGYAGDLAALQEALTEGTDFLAKPFAVADLARRVRALLDGTPA